MFYCLIWWRICRIFYNVKIEKKLENGCKNFWLHSSYFPNLMKSSNVLHQRLITWIIFHSVYFYIGLSQSVAENPTKIAQYCVLCSNFGLIQVASITKLFISWVSPRAHIFSVDILQLNKSWNSIYYSTFFCLKRKMVFLCIHRWWNCLKKEIVIRLAFFFKLFFYESFERNSRDNTISLLKGRIFCFIISL